MQHPGPDRLVLAALRSDPLTDPDAGAHLATCARCRSEVAALRETAGGPGPPDRVWHGIAARLPQRPPPARRTWRQVAVPAVAGVLGVLVGVLAAVLAPAIVTGGEPVAEATLTALQGRGGAGNARLVERDGGRVLLVHIEELPAHPGYYEVWLVDLVSGGLYSVGTMPVDDHDSTFVVPAGLALTRFGTVEVSAEEFDGDPAHSRHSVLRGPLRFG